MQHQSKDNQISSNQESITHTKPNNRVAIVTGGAKGIGKAIVLSLAKQGYHVIINYLGSEAKASQTKDECLAYGVEAMVHRCDVSKTEEVEAMMKHVYDTFGRIDVLVNNSGITKDGLILRMSETEFTSVIDVNLKGTFLCCKHVAKYFLRQKQGNIINISSVVGVSGNAGQVNYASSKAGIIGLTKSLAKELASRNVRVNAIAPGYIVSDMSDAVNEQMKDKIMAAIPLQRFGRAEEVANVVKFLASDDASYLTGQVIHVDGGMVM